MADYNIYIHNIGGGSNQSSPTTPWSQKEGGDETPTQAWESNQTNGISLPRISSVAMNPDSLVSKGIGFSKAIPAIAIAFVVTNMISKVFTNAVEIHTMESGDFKWQRTQEILRQGFSAMTHPFSTIYNRIVEEIRNTIEAQRRRLQAELLGDSVINSYFNRGV